MFSGTLPSFLMLNISRFLESWGDESSTGSRSSESKPCPTKTYLQGDTYFFLVFWLKSDMLWIRLVIEIFDSVIWFFVTQISSFLGFSPLVLTKFALFLK